MSINYNTNYTITGEQVTDLANRLSYIDQSIPTVNDATLTVQQNGSTVATFTANSASNTTANIAVPTFQMTTTDPGEGVALADNNFILVYEV